MSLRQYRASRMTDSGDGVTIIDQTLLPGEEKYISLYTPDEMFEAIYSLRVRGAPAIGIFAAYALAALSKSCGLSGQALADYVKKQAEYLSSSRPTAVNLSRQAERMAKKAEMCVSLSREDAVTELRHEAELIYAEDAKICRAISEYGLSLIKDGFSVLTHCNAGPLATSEYGTGLGALILGCERGMTLNAYCDETRPLLQGARLTALELREAGVNVTVICDNMAASLMAAGKIDACFVGCDRVAKNGDAANKIGTLGVAVLAKHFGVPFYVFCPGTTVDLNCKSGKDIVIEQRSGDEIGSMHYKKRMTPDGVGFYNPAFDVTPGELITAIITEKGIFRYPYNMEEAI